MEKPLRVLIVEDSEDDAILMVRMLQKGGFKPIWKRVDNVDALSGAIENEPWDIVLSDYHLPGFDGRKVLATVKGKNLDMPIIVISGFLIEEDAVEILKAGAGDFVPKGHWARFIPAIERELREAQVRREKRRAKQAKEKAEAKYRLLFENMGEGVFQTTAQGRFVVVNPAMARILGYDSPESLIQSISDIGEQLYVNPADHHAFVRQVTNKGTASRFETQFYRRDGSKIWISIHAHGVKENNGNLNFIEGWIEDISERKKSKEALQLNEARIKALLKLSQMTEASPDQLAAFAFEEAVTLTRSAIGYLGFMNADETVFTITCWSKNVMKECAVKEKDFIKGVATGGLWAEAIRQRKPVITNDYSLAAAFKKGYPLGHVDLQRHLSVPVFDGDRLVAAAGVANKQEPYDESDVQQLTLLMQGMWQLIQHRRAEEALKESEERYRILLGAIPDPVTVYDPQGRVLYVNQAFERTFGWGLNELYGLNIDFVPSHENEKTRKAIEKTMRGEEVQFETQRLTRNGTLLDIQIKTSIFRDREGRIAGDIVIYRNITEQKRLESQLLQAQKMEAIGTLAGGVAHDFNNILTAILGSAELGIRKVEESDPLRRQFQQIQKSALRAADLTRQLLIFSRKQPMEYITLNLNFIIKNMLKMFQRLIGEDILIHTELAPDLWNVQGDEGNIEQVIMNLAVNARDAMPDGGKLTIKTCNTVVDASLGRTNPDARAGKFVLLTVMDTGVGMDQNVVQHIFEPFFSTKEFGKGTGLGLSVVHGIAKQHKGWITVDSEPDYGSVFQIYLPAFSGPAKTETEPEISLADLQGKGERILLVEDDEKVREIADKILSENGYVVTAAASFKEALDVFERAQYPFDIIFSDVVLPDEDGLQLVNRLIAKDSKLKVLLSSGYTDHKSKWPLITERGFSYLEKPYKINVLLQAIKTVLDRKSN